MWSSREAVKAALACLLLGALLTLPHWVLFEGGPLSLLVAWVGVVTGAPAVSPDLMATGAGVVLLGAIVVGIPLAAVGVAIFSRKKRDWRAFVFWGLLILTAIPAQIASEDWVTGWVKPHGYARCKDLDLNINSGRIFRIRLHGWSKTPEACAKAAKAAQRPPVIELPF